MLPTTKLVFLLYEKDPAEYSDESFDTISCPEPLMVDRVNGALGLLDGFTSVGWVADDNRFRTKGWDEMVAEHLTRTPIVFGNDVVSPGSKPSHVFMDARIPRALGWLLLPGLHRAFFDDAWQTLGTAKDATLAPFDELASKMGTDYVRVGHGGVGIAYMHGVVVEHLYVERPPDGWFEKDMTVYRHWLRHQAEEDIGKARSAIRSRRNPMRLASAALEGAEQGAV